MPERRKEPPVVEIGPSSDPSELSSQQTAPSLLNDKEQPISREEISRVAGEIKHLRRTVLRLEVLIARQKGISTEVPYEKLSISDQAELILREERVKQLSQIRKELRRLQSKLGPKK